MSNLKHLVEFTIVPCANFKQVVGNKKQIPDNTLKSLKLLKCSIGNCWNILHFGGNLTTLQILNCNIMKFNDYQLLFNNLTNLMHLKICDCMNLDDNAFLDLNIFNIKGKELPREYYNIIITIFYVFRVGYIGNFRCRPNIQMLERY